MVNRSMKLIDLYVHKQPVLSLEIFPPRASYPLDNLFNVLDSLKTLIPDFISVTYGAGGHNRERTVDIAARIKREYGIESMAHLTGICHTRSDIEAILDQLTEEDIYNIIALRGDPPDDDPGFDFNQQEYRYAYQLIEHARSKDSFGIAAAVHPEGHPASASREDDLRHLKHKVAVGVDFLITQLFFDNQVYYSFMDRALAIGIEVPVVPGIFPVRNSQQVLQGVKLGGATVPLALTRLLNKYYQDPSSMEAAGIEYACHQIEDLLSNRVPGVHLYTMNKAEHIMEIVRNVGLAR